MEWIKQMVKASLINTCGKKKRYKIVMFGLDYAGKTKALYEFIYNQNTIVTPTIGFNIEELDYKNDYFMIWDINGGVGIRKLWKHYMENAHGFIMVIDSNDRERLDEAKREFEIILDEQKNQNLPILILANKQDLNGSLKVSEIIEKFNLNEIFSQAWHVEPSSATENYGFKEGFDWLAQQIICNQK